MFKEGWEKRLADLITLIYIISFIILGIYWKINIFSLIVILTGGAITVWWAIVLIFDFIKIVQNFIRTGRI